MLLTPRNYSLAVFPQVGSRQCFEADIPLSRNYKRGIGLQDRVVFSAVEGGMATFSDIQFKGHPAQRYNITFSIVNLGDQRYVEPKSFSTSWVVDYQPCPSGQLGTWDRSCECARGFEPGGASGCQRCEGGSSVNEGDASDERGKYKPKPGQQMCTKCPSKNMISQNSTTRDSVGTCFCARGFFRAAVVYDYNLSFSPDIIQTPDGSGALQSSCGGPGSSSVKTGAADIPEVGRRRARRQDDENADEGAENADEGAEVDNNVTEFDEDDFVFTEDGTVMCLAAIEFESVDCGRVTGHLMQDAFVTTTEETNGECTHSPNTKVCTKCRSRLGCQGDKFGVGIQGCKQYYKGVMCALCEKGHYAKANGDCTKCPDNDSVYMTLALGAVGAAVGGAIAVRYLALIKMLADPPSVRF